MQTTLKLEPLIAAKNAIARKQTVGRPKKSVQSSAPNSVAALWASEQKRKKTRDELARIAGVSHDTIAFVASANLHRRHLTQSQKSAVAVEVEEHLAKAAKERQRVRKGKQPGATVETFPQLNGDGKARTEAAALVGVSPHYVTDAKAVKAAVDKNDAGGAE